MEFGGERLYRGSGELCLTRNDGIVINLNIGLPRKEICL